MRAGNICVLLLAATLAAAPVDVRAVHATESVELPSPRMTGGMPLMEALAQRRSLRAFSDQALDDQTLSSLLWAAFGINRPEQGDRTAPSWRGSKETHIYVARADGVWLYDPKQHALRRVLEDDVREAAGRAPFVKQAPMVLIYVADRSRMAEAPVEDQRLYAHVDTAFISQNVYLFAASEGLATVVLGNVEKPALAKILKLREDQILTFTQPVGRPR
jgi:SagB-type dehydrogenase family enzyme